MLTALVPVAGYARAMFEVRGAGRAVVKKLTVEFAVDILPWCLAGILIAGFTFALARHGANEPVNLISQAANRLTDLARPETLGEGSPTATAAGLFIVYITLLGVGAFAPYGAGRPFRRQLTIFVGVLLILYIIIPDSIGNADYIAQRVLWTALVVVGVVAVSGALGSNAPYLRSCAICATAIMVVFAAEYLLVSRRMEPAVQELRAALKDVPPRSTILLLAYRVTPRCGRWSLLDETVPERHWGMLEAIPRELIVLNDYEPATAHFPVMYRDQRFSSIVDEFKFTTAAEDAWDRALDSAEVGTLVLSWGVPSGRTGGCDAWVKPPLVDRLRRHYELRYESANSSRLQVWERVNYLP